MVLLFSVSGGAPNFEAVVLSGFYFSLFLSCCYILNQVIKKFSPHAPILIGLLGLGIVMFLPTVIVSFLEALDYRQRYISSDFLRYANWYRALTLQRGNGGIPSATTYNFMEWVGFCTLAVTTIITTVYALLSACREFSVIHLATPDHVLEEDRDHARRDPLGRKQETIDDIFE